MSDLALARDHYYWFTPITTRWMDNDIYGHVNNVTYYSYFDTIANRFLIERGGLDIQHADVIGYVVSSQCNYRSAIAFPQSIEGGFRVNKIGNSSVEYGLAIFAEGEDQASAHGSFTHVFVDRNSERPQAIPEALRAALESVLVVA
ncbi:acyl-CoA thioesterase [Spongiibacter nanhainus]|uniref:Acyl-CoA thioesterase n=1 Tax=Spongiibacter nanhainus TaxID=2794344 RepID=A0A7T4QZA2_9GAMM|nr:thioesterase family protein [Spongiibacter nanhainus]QQD17560.1 acyl-CoA thioesterase [Spongiibacter nanhainus]